MFPMFTVSALVFQGEPGGEVDSVDLDSRGRAAVWIRGFGFRPMPVDVFSIIQRACPRWSAARGQAKQMKSYFGSGIFRQKGKVFHAKARRREEIVIPG